MKRCRARRFFEFYLGMVLLLAGTSGCGYHFGRTGEPIGIKYESLAIPLMTSTSSTAGFEADFTRIIREEFIDHARVPLVPVESAQTVLTGNVYEIRTEPLTFVISQKEVGGALTTHEVTSRRRLKVKMEAKLTDRTTGRVIWHEKAMEEEATFMVSDDPLALRYQQRQALEKIARRFSKRIFLKTMERF